MNTGERAIQEKPLAKLTNEELTALMHLNEKLWDLLDDSETGEALRTLSQLANEETATRQYRRETQQEKD